MTGQVKVVFDIESHRSAATESMWAERVSEDIYRVLNIPVFVFGISFEDEIEAKPDGDLFRFVRVVRRSGHSTYRIVLDKSLTINGPDFTERWSPFEAAGCSFESFNVGYIAVDMPPSADVSELYKLLQRGEEDGIWEFEEGHFAGNGD